MSDHSRAESCQQHSSLSSSNTLKSSKPRHITWSSQPSTKRPSHRRQKSSILKNAALTSLKKLSPARKHLNLSTRSARVNEKRRKKSQPKKVQSKINRLQRKSKTLPSKLTQICDPSLYIRKKQSKSRYYHKKFRYDVTKFYGRRSKV